MDVGSSWHNLAPDPAPRLTHQSDIGGSAITGPNDILGHRGVSHDYREVNMNIATF